MSGSPKYSVVTYDARRRERIEQARARQAQLRREQELRRQARERERLQRLADQARPATRAAIAAVQALAGQLAQRAGGECASALTDLAAELAALDSTVGTAQAARQAELVREAERVRTQLSEIRIRMAIAEGVAERAKIVSVLRDVLHGADKAGASAVSEQLRQAQQELDQLHAAASEADGFAFDVRRGTAEAAVNRVLLAAASAAEQQRDEQRKRDAARARLEAMTERVRVAAADAGEFAEHDLEQDLQDALTAAADALRTAPAARATAALDALELRTTEAEAVLDDLALAAEQRTELAKALKEAMADQGLFFLGGEDHGPTMTLKFQRPNGAVYQAGIESGGSSGQGAMLTYRIAGEPDVPDGTEVAGVGDRVCTDTEALLSRVHEGLPGEYRAGPLVWTGKPKLPAAPPAGGQTFGGRTPGSRNGESAAGGQTQPPRSLGGDR